MCQVCDAMNEYGHNLMVDVAKRQIPPPAVVNIFGYVVGVIMTGSDVDGCQVMMNFLAGMAKGQQMGEAVRALKDHPDYLQRIAEAMSFVEAKNPKSPKDAEGSEDPDPILH